MGRVTGRVRFGRAAGRVRPIEQASTRVAPLAEPSPPVFADPGGTRRRWLRLLSYAVIALVAVVLLAFWLSQLSPTALGSWLR